MKGSTKASFPGPSFTTSVPWMRPAIPPTRKSTLQKLDILGLLLLGASVALILLPLTLAKTAKGGWKNREWSLFFFGSMD